ncbi:MAG TPA: D-alanyl-D-alanine carboxypeptidase family protein [Arenibaculum sp.]|nr:D-alanyl-D-alanine carboxypeptidase family protein [Arenibaculum sp.]
MAFLVALALVLSGGSREVAAKYAAIVIDADTGRVLHAENADIPYFPASLTKMMTLYLTFEALDAGRIKLDTPLRVSPKAAKQAPTKLGLRPGSTIRVEEAILGLVTKSANDAAVVLAEGLSGSEADFAALMTRKARALGMGRTTFRNPHGLPDARQRSTARDMATLSRALIHDFPERYHYFSRASFTYAGVTHRSHNRLMARYDGMDGLKTGYTRASGFNLASSAVRHGRRLIGVVFGGRSAATRDKRMEVLLDQAFERVRKEGPLVAFLPPLPGHKPGQGGALPRIVPGEAVALASLVPVDGQALDALTERLADVATVGEGDTDPAGKWGIQVGAFSDEETSRRAVRAAAAAVPALLAGTAEQLSAVRNDNGLLYRARLVGLVEADARAACSQLSSAGIACLPIGPADGT